MQKIVFKKIFFKIFFLILGLYVFLALVLYFFQNKFIYYPTVQNFYECQNFADAQKVEVGGTRMYVKKTSNNWIIFYHGNYGSACDRTFLKNLFDVSGYSYIVVEYAGYSNDATKPSEEKLLQNTKDVLNYLQTQNPTKVVIIGESLGSGLATYQAYLSQPTSLILVSPFNNFTDVGKARIPFFPISLMLKDKYPSDERIQNIQNVVIIHGDQDTTIPMLLSQKLFAKILSLNKIYITVEGAGHNNIYNFPKTISAIVDNLK